MDFAEQNVPFNFAGYYREKLHCSDHEIFVDKYVDIC